jgi:tyrosyl-tRNA synthetase
MIMQSYDFYHMFVNNGCVVQCGGDDQWSNILGGTELIRRKLGKDAYGMTITLLLTSEGKKMGKTMGGAVWLDPDKTSPFEFYQYWRNVDDADVMNCLRKMTFLPLEQIDEMSTWKDAKLNEAKEILAYELTSIVHGEEEAKKAQNGARAIFSGAGDSEHMPTTEISSADLTDGSADIIKLMVLTGLCSSNGDARRNIQQGGVTVNDEKINDISKSYSEAELKEGIVIRKGKKTFNKVILK